MGVHSSFRADVGAALEFDGRAFWPERDEESAGPPAPAEEVIMRPIGVLDEQRFVSDTILTTSGTVVRVRYPALDLAHSGNSKQQHQLMQRLRAEVARELLANPGSSRSVIDGHGRWTPGTWS